MFMRNPCILLLDDDTVFRRQMLAYLEVWGARVLEACTLTQGLQLARHWRPDLVLGNLRLPVHGRGSLLDEFSRHHVLAPFIAISGEGNMAEVAAALRAGAVDYLVKPVRHWSAVKRRLAACLLPPRVQEQRELAEFASHLAFYRRQDMAATRLLRDLGASGELRLGSWHLSCHYSTPWVLTQSVRLEQDLLLLAAEFDPLHQDTPMLMLLVAFLLHEPLRQYRSGTNRLLHSPARTLEYLNQRLFETALNASVNLMLLRLRADSNTLEVANGGMAGCDWLAGCNAGPLGRGEFTASPCHQPCRFPLQLNLSGSHGGRIQLTASRATY
ncbi:response regulator [Oceanimonas sp. CHS3-5]|uniref:response regulator n=1 Tax=Oceanimonas sp. CHS3-5 TaxID=3068186 RepID=UPI00273E11E0|nr:response regulator [Oceanimonas sp. CHS3-5]MDP5290881.1 response regulator [Oceanimonas sp. CHS3-5]